MTPRDEAEIGSPVMMERQPSVVGDCDAMVSARRSAEQEGLLSRSGGGGGRHANRKGIPMIYDHDSMNTYSKLPF